MIASCEHSAKAEATAGESLNVPFEERYFEAMVQVFRGYDPFHEEESTTAARKQRTVKTT